MPKFVINNEYVPISVYFIETFLKEAQGDFIKVYLFGLNLAMNGTEIDFQQIALELNLSENVVTDAINYWKEKGMILEESGIVEFCSKPINIDSVDSEIQNAKQSDYIYDKKQYSSIEVSNTISNNQSLQELVLIAQEMFGKPLTQQELDTLFWFYDGLGFSTEAILTILEYCISKEKKNMRYIEKVAMSWHENGIRTVEQMMDYILECEKQSTQIYQIQKGLGINDRQLSNAEEEYIKKWLYKFDMSEEMIMLAYECCILNTAKLSIPYIDKILDRWYRENIHTKEAAQENNRKFKDKIQGGFAAFDDDIEHTNLESFTRN